MNQSKGPNSSSKAAEFFSQTSGAFQGFYSTDPDFHDRRALWAAMVFKYAAGRKEALDLGCGPGMLTQELLKANLKVTAVDGSEEMVALCRQNLSSHKGSPAEILHDYLPTVEKLGRRTFDLLLCSSVLEYVDNLPLALARISQLLKPGGVAIISLPNRESLYRKIETVVFKLAGKPEYRAHVKHMLSRAEMAALAKQTGLTITECKYYGDGSSFFARLSRPLPEAKRKNLFLCVFVAQHSAQAAN